MDQYSTSVIKPSRMYVSNVFECTSLCLCTRETPLLRLKVAVGLQKLYRGRLGRRLFLTISKDRRERLAATRIQAATRGMWGRQQAER